MVAPIWLSSALRSFVACERVRAPALSAIGWRRLAFATVRRSVTFSACSSAGLAWVQPLKFGFGRLAHPLVPDIPDVLAVTVPVTTLADQRLLGSVVVEADVPRTQDRRAGQPLPNRLALAFQLGLRMREARAEPPEPPCRAGASAASRFFPGTRLASSSSSLWLLGQSVAERQAGRRRSDRLRSGDPAHLRHPSTGTQPSLRPDPRRAWRLDDLLRRCLDAEPSSRDRRDAAPVRLPSSPERCMTDVRVDTERPQRRQFHSSTSRPSRRGP